MKWDGKDAFNAVGDRDWIVDGEQAGVVRTLGSFGPSNYTDVFTFLQIHDAGMGLEILLSFLHFSFHFPAVDLPLSHFLQFMHYLNLGHMVPMDQPARALAMLHNFTTFASLYPESQ